MSNNSADDERLPLQDRRNGERRTVGDGRQLQGSGQSGHDRKSDRRKLLHGVAVSTIQSAATLERWLQDMCEGGWSIALEDIDPALQTKKFRLMFEHENDKRQFVSRFARR